MKKILLSLLAVIMLMGMAACGTPEASPSVNRVKFTNISGQIMYYEYEYLGTTLTAFRIVDKDSAVVKEYKSTESVTVTATQATRGAVTVRLTHNDAKSTVETVSYINGRYEHVFNYINNSKGEQILVLFEKYDKNGDLIIKESVTAEGLDRYLTYTYEKEKCIVTELDSGNITLFIHRYKSVDGALIEDFSNFFDETGLKIGWVTYEAERNLTDIKPRAFIASYADGVGRTVELKDANGKSYGTAVYDANGNLVVEDDE